MPKNLAVIQQVGLIKEQQKDYRQNLLTLNLQVGFMTALKSKENCKVLK